ncbi:MAG: hypothetical protein KDE56_21655 [Anaerolineales bacterium]|nr:hypothetical protein [Anaerolineales bacterium]
MQLCPECRKLGWEQYGTAFHKDMYAQVKAGWRPPTPPEALPLDYKTLSTFVGNVELGADTYSQFAELAGGKALPDAIGLRLVLINVGIENKDESLLRMGYEMIAYAGVDVAVDAGAGYAAIKAAGVGGAVAGPIGAVVVGVGAFVGVQVLYNRIGAPLC